MTYKEFLERKIDIAPLSGIEIDPAEVSPALKDHQRVSVLWALRGGGLRQAGRVAGESPGGQKKTAASLEKTETDSRGGTGAVVTCRRW